MDKGIYSSAAAMGAAERRLEAVAANLANLNAPGYKRVGSASQSFDVVLRGKVQRQVASRTVRDFSQGALRASGNVYDLALAGSGFFAVETPQGEAYTRDGRFRIDGEGVLQTLDGMPVAWEGARGTIDPNGPEAVVDAEGHVRQGETTVGRLKLAGFERPERLEPVGSGLWRAPIGLRAAAWEAEVRQGYVEEANTSAVDEMVALVAVQRSFESAARLMSQIEQSYRRLTASGR